MTPRTAREPRRETAVPPDEACIRLSEETLIDGLADTRWLLRDALSAGVRRIVIDVGNAGPLSSEALASFLWAHRTCRARGGGVVLRGPDRRTRAMLGRTGLERVLGLQAADGRAVA